MFNWIIFSRDFPQDDHIKNKDKWGKMYGNFSKMNHSKDSSGFFMIWKPRRQQHLKDINLRDSESIS